MVAPSAENSRIISLHFTSSLVMSVNDKPYCAQKPKGGREGGSLSAGSLPTGDDRASISFGQQIISEKQKTKKETNTLGGFQCQLCVQKVSFFSLSL